MPFRSRASTQIVFGAFLVAVIAAAAWLAVHQYATDARREYEREVMRNAPPGAFRRLLSPAELAEASTPMRLDTAWLDAATEEQGVLNRFGSGDSVVVYAVVPRGGCHGDALEVLRNEATKHQGQVRVAALLLGSEAAHRIGLGCAGYIINGVRVYTYQAEDGAKRTAIFEGKPDQDWTEQELEQAVEAALKASTPVGRGTESDQG